MKGRCTVRPEPATGQDEPAGTIDELAVARATAALHDLARRHPEAFHPDRLPATEQAFAVALGERRKRAPKGEAQVTFTLRLQQATLAALHELARARGISPRVMARAAIERMVAEAGE